MHQEKSSYRLRKIFSGCIATLKFGENISRRMYQISGISSRILDEQLACTVSKLPDAGFMLLCVGLPTMLEVEYEILSAFYCLKL